MLAEFRRAFVVPEEVDVRRLIRILRSFDFIVKIDPLAVAPRDDLKTAVVPVGIVQIVGEEDLLRPRGQTDRVIPVHPVVVPVESRSTRRFGEQDKSTVGLEIVQSHGQQRVRGRLPVDQSVDELVVVTPQVQIRSLIL